MPKFPTYPDGGVRQAADEFIIARGGDNYNILGSKIPAPIVVTVTVAATPAINTDNGEVFRVGVAGDLLDLAITSMTTNLSGSPTHGEKIIIEFLDDGTGRAITWGASFRSTGAALPTTTTASKLLRVTLMYDSVDSKWDCVATAEEA